MIGKKLLFKEEQVCSSFDVVGSSFRGGGGLLGIGSPPLGFQLNDIANTTILLFHISMAESPNGKSHYKELNFWE